MTTIVDEFEKYIGVHEYDGIVATIQIWYYGTLVRDAWCATSTSYFANVAGILDQIGGKHEGVSEMLDATRALHKNDGRFFEYPHIPRDLQKHDIIFFKRSGMSHVAHLWRNETYLGIGTMSVLGGNQSDMICKKEYKQEGIQAVYRPLYKTMDYTHTFPLLKRGDSGSDVYTLQRLLRGMGYKQTSTKLLGLSKIYGPKTEKCVKEFQKRVGIEVDGITGPETWTALLK